MATIGFIGAGNMAEALIKGIISAQLYKPRRIFIADILPQRLKQLSAQYGVQPLEDNAQLAEKADIVVLSVKPQNISEALAGIKTALRPGTLVISIAAGIKTANIASVLPDVPIVRAMPNTPALVGEGTAALFATASAKPHLQNALDIFQAVGTAVVVEDEQLIDAVTATSGSGPAYFFLLMEEMIRAAARLGLDADTAKKLVLQTAKGAAVLATGADFGSRSPAELREKVTSPGGTTEAALKVFAQGKFGELVERAMIAARDRAGELSG